jgi:anti-anti-sigma regulatory factor
MSGLKIMSLPEVFDFHFHKQFSQQSDEIFSDASFSSIELDFSAVTFLDSSALGMMILLHKKARAKNIKTSIRGANGLPAEILKKAHLTQFFDLN